MLSNQELHSIQQALEKNLSKNTERKLKKKLTEHDYASKHPPFSPLSHHRHFLNRKTDEQALHQVIDAAKISEIILLDTESITVYRQRNRPGLIQIQLIPNDELPVVIIVEVHHLPATNSNEFKLMQELFRIVLDSEKIIYTWGTIDELKPFVPFNLFNTEQIDLPEKENLQDIFKKYWQQCHEHKNTEDCNCEGCLGKKSNQPWKLIDAVAHQLHEWLDKRHTCSPFDIGLDPRLQQLCTEQLEYRIILTNYAANDVLSMEKLMVDMQERPPPTKKPIDNPENIFDAQDETLTNATDEIPAVLLLHPSSPLISTEHQYEEINREETEHQYEEMNGEETEHQRIKHEETNREHHREVIYRQHPREETEHQRIEHEETEHQRIEHEETEHQRIEHEETNREHRREVIYRQHQREETNRYDQREGKQTYYSGEQHQTDFQYEQEETNQHQRTRNRTDHQREREEIYHRYSRERYRTNIRRERHRIEREEYYIDIERKRRNRIRTLKQRQRHFRYEIIRRGIDPRFSVKIVKEILRRYEIPYTTVNISKSKITRRTSLYIGIRNPSKICKYENRTRNLFTTDYYNEFQARNRFRR